MSADLVLYVNSTQFLLSALVNTLNGILNILYLLADMII